MSSDPGAPFGRETTLRGLLARLGFDRPERAEAILTETLESLSEPEAASVVVALGRSPDPDRAALALSRIVDELRTHAASGPGTAPAAPAASVAPAGVVRRPARPGQIGPSSTARRPMAAAAPAARPASPADEFLTALATDEALRRRIAAVLGASAALGDHLVRHPEDWKDLAGAAPLPARDRDDLQADLLRAVGADPDDPPTGSAGSAAADHGPATLDALRREYRRLLLSLAARDLTGTADLVTVARELADLAAGALSAGMAIALAAERARAGDLPPVRLAIIGMGKTGGRELNYISDVDVIFVAEPGSPPAAGIAGITGPAPAADAGATGDGHDTVELAMRTAARLATAAMAACSVSTAEGRLWEVDAALRPEGKNGPLVRTLASHRAYYERWAKTWEFQALLKAVPLAGDLDLGLTFVGMVRPMVWHASTRDNFVVDVQAMRRRVEKHIPRAEVARQIKLGPGGLRDIEFAVQLLQLVHGRGDRTLRSPNTLAALEALSTGGYVGRTDASDLDRAYRFLRTLEHRVQLDRLRRTHLLPTDPADLRRIGRSLGLPGDPAESLIAEREKHARTVRRLHEKIFYRPLLASVARLPGDENVRLTAEAARARLTALGFASPDQAIRHLEALTSGVTRRSAIQRTLLPVMLGWFADAHDPDGGLLAFRRVSEALGGTPWYLRLLRDSEVAAERLSRVLAGSRYLGDLVTRAPDAVRFLGDDTHLVPQSQADLTAEFVATVRRYDDPEDAMEAVRGLRRREIVRIGSADLLGRADIHAVGAGLTDLGAASLAAALDCAQRSVALAGGGDVPPQRMCLVAMGRFGGREMGYASDADVVVVHAPAEGPLDGPVTAAETSAAIAVANEVKRLLSLPTADPPFPVDYSLRPEGRNAPVARSFGSYRAYLAQWSLVWEAQALLRALPIAGDAELGEAFRELIDPVRYPAGGLPDASVREIRRIKARVESERLPRGADPATHTKLGRGGLADVEWAAQLLQLQHAHAVGGLRTTSTLPALAAARDAELLTVADEAALREAWELASRVRNAIMLVSGRAADSLPTDLRVLAGVARAVGYGPGEAGLLREQYLRVTRRARTVVEKVVYGRED